jgi:hypothetical protein
LKDYSARAYSNDVRKLKPKAILEENLGGLFPARKPWNRWKVQIEKNAATFFNTKTQHATARHRNDLRKKRWPN